MLSVCVWQLSIQHQQAACYEKDTSSPEVFVGMVNGHAHAYITHAMFLYVWIVCVCVSQYVKQNVFFFFYLFLVERVADNSASISNQTRMSVIVYTKHPLRLEKC